MQCNLSCLKKIFLVALCLGAFDYIRAQQLSRLTQPVDDHALVTLHGTVHPLANAANDGISGVVDPYGRVTARLGLGKIGVVDADLPRPIPETLYARLGDGPFFVMAALLAMAGFVLGRRKPS